MPKSFKNRGRRDRALENLFKEKEYNPATVNMLLNSCDDFLKTNLGHCSYKYDLMGIALANKIDYTKNDLEELSKNLIGNEENRSLGIYLSALVNKIIRDEDTITLTVDGMSWLGMYQEKGTLIVIGDQIGCTGYEKKGGLLRIEGSVREFTGDSMRGGMIIVDESAWNHTCYKMRGGIVVVKKDVEDNTGQSMREKSLLMVGRNIRGLGENCKGIIYKKGKKVWPK